jgi:hypothetical protein
MKINFNNLPLGARFKYLDGKDVYVVLERYGLGKIAKVNESVAMQQVFSAKDSVDQALVVDMIPYEDCSLLKTYIKALRSVLVELIRISDRKHDVWDRAKWLLSKCPECGSDDFIQIDNEGDGVAPESTYFLCNDCGYASDPE